MSLPEFPRRAIHLDFHTLPAVYDVGVDFDADEFSETLQQAGVDYITVFARCNLGFAYYPTQVGTVHPGLQVPDLLGPMVDACHQRGIRIAAYINAGLDHEHALRHREWCKLDRQGRVYDCESMGHFFRRMCLNTGYGQHVLAMVDEVLERYTVDGLFLDCFSLSPCYGVECVDGMGEAGLDVHDEEQAREFCWQVTERFVRAVEERVTRMSADIYLCYNGLPYRWQPTHSELEVLPTSFWGYEHLPWSIRYARTLDKPYFTMTGRFHRGWGDFGGLRPFHSLLFDCFNSLANGGTCSIGDHLHPRARLEPVVYDLVERVYERVRQLEPWTTGARPLAEIAVVEPSLERYPGDRFEVASLKGATRMLMELKQQFDVCDSRADLSGYRIVILPDHVSITDTLRLKLERHLSAGGAIISSAWSGLQPGGSGFALDAYRFSYEGAEPFDPTFFRPRKGWDRGVPDMPVTVYDQGIAMRPLAGAETLADLHQPYFNDGTWNWYHEHVYTPPEEETGRPALARSGNIFHFGFPVFRAYHDSAVIAYRALLANCITSVLPRPLLLTARLPSFAQVTVTARDRMKMVHVLTYVPELRGAHMQVIEEPVTATGVGIALRDDERAIQHVYLAPQRDPLGFAREDGYAVVELPVVEGYQMVVMESGRST
jgi:hypothetical protein